MILYVAGPYRAETPDGVTANIAAARAVGIALWEAGHVAIVPHLNTAGFEFDCKVNADTYIQGDLTIVERCDGIVMLRGWGESAGATMEHGHAIVRGIPIWYWPDSPPPPPFSQATATPQPPMLGTGNVLKDSGARQSFAAGAVRDLQDGKGRFDLLPPLAMTRLAVLFEAGAKKYDARNWEKGINLSRFIDSALRHAFKFLAGERDEDHAIQAAWNMLCLVQTEEMVHRGLLPDTLSDLPDYTPRPRRED